MRPPEDPVPDGVQSLYDQIVRTVKEGDALRRPYPPGAIPAGAPHYSAAAPTRGGRCGCRHDQIVRTVKEGDALRRPYPPRAIPARAPHYSAAAPTRGGRCGCRHDQIVRTVKEGDALRRPYPSGAIPAGAPHYSAAAPTRGGRCGCRHDQIVRTVQEGDALRRPYTPGATPARARLFGRGKRRGLQVLNREGGAQRDRQRPGHRITRGRANKDRGTRRARPSARCRSDRTRRHGPG